MRTFLILALLAVVAISANATTTCTPGFECQEQPCIQQQPFYQPYLLQQLNPCKVFLQQQCSPLTLTMAVPFLRRAQMWQQSSCHLMQQQCCQQLVQIPEQTRCQAMCSIVHAIFMQQHQFGQGSFFQPQQVAQFEATRAMALQTLPAMCNVYVPPYCCSTTGGAPFGSVASCAGGACF